MISCRTVAAVSRLTVAVISPLTAELQSRLLEHVLETTPIQTGPLFPISAASQSHLQNLRTQFLTVSHHLIRRSSHSCLQASFLPHPSTTRATTAEQLPRYPLPAAGTSLKVSPLCLSSAPSLFLLFLSFPRPSDLSFSPTPHHHLHSRPYHVCFHPSSSCQAQITLTFRHNGEQEQEEAVLRPRHGERVS